MDDCIRWHGSIGGNGYGQLMINRRNFAAHRIAWAEANGWRVEDMTADMVIRHTCDNKWCVNPEHLLLGTHTDNMQDAVSKGLHWQMRKTHCRSGHEFTPENTYITPSTGWRQCKKCNVNRPPKKEAQHA